MWRLRALQPRGNGKQRGDLHQHLFRARFYEQNGVGKTIAQWLGDVLNDQAEHLGTSGASIGGAGSGSTGGAGTGP